MALLVRRAWLTVSHAARLKPIFTYNSLVTYRACSSLLPSRVIEAAPLIDRLQQRLQVDEPAGVVAATQECLKAKVHIPAGVYAFISLLICLFTMFVLVWPWGLQKRRRRCIMLL
jgi:hypothetical protein